MLFDRHSLLTLSAKQVHFDDYGPPTEFCMVRSNIQRWLPHLPLSYRNDISAISSVACLTASISKCPIKIARTEVGIDCGSCFVRRRPNFIASREQQYHPDRVEYERAPRWH